MTTAREPAPLAQENASLRERIAALEASAKHDADAAVFLQSVLAAVPMFIARTDNELRIRYINRYQPGITPEQVMGASILAFIAEEYRAAARAVLEHTRLTGELGQYETIGMGAHGQIANYVTHVSAVREPDGTAGLCVVATEVTVHRQREQALIESQAKLRLAVEATGLGLWSWDAATDELVWDDVMQRVYDRAPMPSAQPPAATSAVSNVLERYVQQFVDPRDQAEVRTRLERVVQTGEWQSAQYRIVRPNGEVRWLLTKGRVILGPDEKVRKLMGGALDITDIKRLEEQLRQAQKMEALGSLTAGIAHNFNNMLAAIIPTIDMAIALVPPPRQTLLHEAAHAARRAAELVQQLMTFTGQRQHDEQKPTSIAEIVQAAVAICARVFDRRVELHTHYEGPSATVECNPGQIEQVLVNLLLNARDAVLATPAGTGRVSARVVAGQHTLPSAATHGGTQAAVSIEISDNGTGMTDDVRSKVFEPFFTTKAVGRGTGLGLTMSYAIVRDHGGTLACESELGVQTTFTLLLPTTDKPRVSRVPELQMVLPKGLRVLIVDDEPAVRLTITHLLTDAGAFVQQAGSGTEALALLARDPTVEVLLLDRSMPDTPGEAFVARIREVVPNARIMFFSGQMVEPALAARVDGVLLKPVQYDELVRAIQRALALPATR